MKKRIYVATLLMFICLVTACGQDLTLPQFRTNPKANLKDMKCYKTFEEFAYTDFIQSSEKWLPTEPWQVQATIPEKFYGDYIFGDVQFVRFVNGDPEIWIRRWGIYQDDDFDILIYYPLSDTWSSISDVVGDSDISVSSLYLIKDGSVWGKIYWYDERKNVPNQGSSLSKYNEQSNQFEFVSGVLQIPFADEEKYSTLLFDDTNNVFWIGIGTDGLYTYEPDNNIAIKQIELQDMPIGLLASATDGTVYFASTNHDQMLSSQPPFHIYEGMLVQFSPETKELSALKIPEPSWPFLGPPLITKSDHLWIGSIGYMDLVENRWNLLVDPSDYYVGGYLAWPAAPQMMLEDETGVTWFGLASEQRGGGLAWYDPDTREGCMFTNSYTNIVQDEQNQLWMFADGKLYRLALDD